MMILLACAVSAASMMWSLWVLLPGMIVLFAQLIHSLARYEEREKARKESERALPPGIPFGSSPPPVGPAPSLEPPAFLTVDAGGVKGLAFSPRRRLLAAASAGTAILFDLTDLANPCQVATLAGGSSLHALALSPDERLLATGGAYPVVLWDVATATRPVPIATITHPHYGQGQAVVCALDFSADGRLLATAGRNGTVAVWDIARPAHPSHASTIVYNRLNRHRPPSGLRAARFSPRRRLLAGGGHRDSVRAAMLWDITDPARPTRTAALRPHPTVLADGSGLTVHAVAFSPDGRLLATASDRDYTSVSEWWNLISLSFHDSMVVLWDITDPAHPIKLATLAERGGDRTTTTNRKRRRRPVLLTGHTSMASTLAFNPSGRLLATGSDDTTILVWDIADPARPRHTLALPHPGGVTAVVWTGETTLASGCKDGAVRLWKIR
jgi:WD40 repeat protein